MLSLPKIVSHPNNCWNIRIIVVSRLFACFAQFFFIDCFKSISNAFYHYIKYKFVFKLCFHALSLDTFVDFA